MRLTLGTVMERGSWRARKSTQACYPLEGSVLRDLLQRRTQARLRWQQPAGLIFVSTALRPVRETDREGYTRPCDHLVAASTEVGEWLATAGRSFGVEMSTAIAAWGQNLGVLACVHLHLSYAEVIFSLALTLICQLQQSLFVAKSIMFNCVITRHFSTR